MSERLSTGLVSSFCLPIESQFISKLADSLICMKKKKKSWTNNKQFEKRSLPVDKEFKKISATI